MLLSELNQRSLEIFRELVDSYMETGEPVGSRTVSKRLSHSLSPATVRNIMADLEDMGLLYAPHTSAGRLPTPEGLKLFVHSLLEMGAISDIEQESIAKCCQGVNMPSVLEDISNVLSGLSKCAGLVMAQKYDTPLKYIEFILLSEGRVLVILVSEDNAVENRLIHLPDNVSASSLSQATNYINARIIGKTLTEVRKSIQKERDSHQEHLDEMSQKLVALGLGVWNNETSKSSLIVRGQSHLLDTVTEVDELDIMRRLFSVLDTQDTLTHLLDASIQSDGMQIFIGAENELFKLSGCSLVVAPYCNKNIVGALGVIGPSRMNYGRIIPLVDYTAKLLSKILDQ